jgi:hypothetical protein
VKRLPEHLAGGGVQKVAGVRVTTYGHAKAAHEALALLAGQKRGDVPWRRSSRRGAQITRTLLLLRRLVGYAEGEGGLDRETLLAMLEEAMAAERMIDRAST